MYNGHSDDYIYFYMYFYIGILYSVLLCEISYSIGPVTYYLPQPAGFDFQTVSTGGKNKLQFKTQATI